MGVHRVGLHVEAMQRRVDAVELLHQYTDHLGEHILPWCDKVVAALVPNLAYTFSTACRSGAALCAPKLVHAKLRAAFKAKLANDPNAAAALHAAGATLNALLQPLLGGIEREHDSNLRFIF